jgi:hypothetical protein
VLRDREDDGCRALKVRRAGHMRELPDIERLGMFA